VSTFLLEIGTEELPADFARLALPQLEQLVRRDLATLRLSHERIYCTSTPRRLVVSVTGLPRRQPDLEEERKGPPQAQALKDGQPTAAALGFAKRCGVPPEALEIRDTPKGPFLFASCLEPGQPTTDVLATQVPLWIEALQGRRFMRWGEGESRFSRPVRWLVALLDTELLSVSLAGSDPVVTAGRESRGHRLHQANVTIPSAEAHADLLASAGLEVDRDSRGALIRSAVEAAALTHNAEADLPEALFQELIDLVESPSLLEGQFDDHYLGLPAEVLSTVMRSHQRYVPLYAREHNLDPLALDARGSLLPRFLFVSNALPEAAVSVARGNERVLKARLADAEFFIRADRNIASIDRRSQLERVTFAEGLGSLLDRTERLEWFTDVLLEQLELSPSCGSHARRAAHLCKHDLVSQMVGEFPELQGAMGGKYLVAEGEPHQVGLAVLEHYLPRGAGDALPSSDAGAVVALAERLELLLSIYAKGERPTGSSDPYALRRAGQGLLQILWEKGWRLDLLALLQRSCLHWAELLPHYAVDAENLSIELSDFLRQRLVTLLEESGMDVDLVQAVAGHTGDQGRVLSDPEDARQRVALLMELRRSGQLAAVQAVVTRAARLANQAELPTSVLSATGVVDADLFEKSSEAGMLAVLNKLEPIATSCAHDRYRYLASGLSAGAPALAAFFDGEQSVMVMAEDGAVRRNRLHLLGVLRNQASVLADFSRIVG
jgi:glycyl-tRNA synthetase beta chain